MFDGFPVGVSLSLTISPRSEVHWRFVPRRAVRYRIKHVKRVAPVPDRVWRVQGPPAAGRGGRGGSAREENARATPRAGVKERPRYGKTDNSQHLLYFSRAHWPEHLATSFSNNCNSN